MCPQPHRMVHHQDLFRVQGPLAHAPARTSHATLSDSFVWISVTCVRIGKASTDPLILFAHFQLSAHRCTLIIFNHFTELLSKHACTKATPMEHSGSGEELAPALRIYVLSSEQT